MRAIKPTPSNPTLGVPGRRRIIFPVPVELVVKLYLDGLTPKEISRQVLCAVDRVNKTLHAAFCCNDLRGTVYHAQHRVNRREVKCRASDCTPN